jgi:hypothetical protein
MRGGPNWFAVSMPHSILETGSVASVPAAG